MGYAVRGSNVGAVKVCTPVQNGHEFQPASYTMSTASFPVISPSVNGVDHTPQHHLDPR